MAAAHVGYRCERCERGYSLSAPVWRCEGCDGPLVLDPPQTLALGDIDPGAPGVWRYAAALPPVPDEQRISLGEGSTPLVDGKWHGLPITFKHEFLQPTGSYKDRGAAVLMSLLRTFGVSECVEDSSGNAAAAMAAYAAAAGIDCQVFVPAGSSPGKLAQTRAHGASLHRIEGDRQRVADAAIRAAGSGRYVGHNWHPLFLAGVATLGAELVEQCDGEVPDSIVTPVGYGNLLLGVWEGLQWLRRSGAITRLPRLIAVQCEAFPAIARAWASGASSVGREVYGTTVAEGIECATPVRGGAILHAIRASGGLALTVSEAEIVVALRELVARGIYVEPTSAVVAAGLTRLIGCGDLRPGGRHVAVLTGSGQKAGALIERLIGSAPEPGPGTAGRRGIHGV